MNNGSVNHVGIATHSLDESETIWKTLGFTPMKDETVLDQGVKIRHMKGSGETSVELLEPLSEDSPIGKFLSKRGPGIQQIAVNISDLDSKILELRSIGVRMINNEPVQGSSGKRIAFIHPSSCDGTLVELVESE
ncbi:MAG: methylmalonyl-CoA epimerase [Euryarchaeota archaeon]|nr:methylmalonyl-CoA epimerase [Euryarchaeota archaeon]|tara:strand:- start:140 stop:544 length:405 start_codon:yes stop_codon:yes gene_type:complete